MKISLTNVDKVNGIIEVNIAKEDYQPKVDNALKTFRKKANVPGFRPGQVPLGMINKMYGKSILADEINKLVGESIYSYIRENKLNILGEPLPNLEKQPEIDFDKSEDFSFFFDIALAPEVSLDLSKKDKLPFYNINVDDELVSKQTKAYQSNFGKYDQVDEEAKETDLLKGKISEWTDGEEKEDGIVVEEGIIMPSYMKDEDEKAKFVGAKTGAIIKFNPGKAYDGNQAELASLLHLEEKEMATLPAEFKFEVAEVTRYQEAELNEELFDRVFGKDKVKTEEEFTQKVRETIQDQFTPDCEYKFMLDAKEMLFAKAGELTFPSEFLKRWMLHTDKKKNTAELDESFPLIENDLKFHLIKEQIAKDNDIKVEQEDLKATAMEAAQAQFAQYGMMGMPAEMIENYANELLKGEENVRNMFDRTMEKKIIDVLKEKVTVEEKNISLDDFRAFFEKEEDKKEAGEDTDKNE